MTIFALGTTGPDFSVAERITLARSISGCVALARSTAAVSAPADANENTLATITIPANSMGAAGRVRITLVWVLNNNANAKTARVKFGGTTMRSVNLASAVSAKDVIEIINTATNVQHSSNAADAAVGGFTPSTSALVAGAVATTADVTVLITAQKAVGGDTMTLQSYLVELFPTA